MNKNGDTTTIRPSLTFEALSYLTNNPLLTNPNEPRQMETYANDLVTTIIKDASKTASENQDENLNNTNELNFLQTSKQTPSEDITTDSDRFDYSTANNDFDYEDIQKKMSNVIEDIRSPSGDDTNLPHQPLTSGHSHHKQMNSSTPTIDPSVRIDSTRSSSELAFIDQRTLTEQPLPIRRDESSSDSDELHGLQSTPTNMSNHIDRHHRNKSSDDDDNFLHTKTGTSEDNRRSLSDIKQNGLDETTRFRTTTPPSISSATSKRSNHVSSDQPSTSGVDKHIHINSSTVLDDTDDDNQAIVNGHRIAARDVPSFNRLRSPTPTNDSRKSSNHSGKDEDTNRSQRSAKNTARSTVNNHHETHSSPLSKGHQHDDQLQGQVFSISKDPSIVAIRRESPHQRDDQHTFRPRSSHNNHVKTTDEHSKLLKSGEQLRIPTNDFDNERVNSPPPSATTGIKAMILFNPLLRSNFNEKESDQSRPPSGTSRKSPATRMITDAKIIDGGILSPSSRRNSDTSQKSIGRHEIEVVEQSSQKSNSPQQQDELNIDQEQREASRRASKASRESPSHRVSFVSEPPISSRRGSVALEQQTSSRKNSIDSGQQSLDKRDNLAAKSQESSRRKGQQQVFSSGRTNTKLDNQSSSLRRSSLDQIDKNDPHIKHKSNSTHREIRTSVKPKEDSTSSIEKNTKHDSPLQRRSEQQSKSKSDSTMNKTVVPPITIDSTKIRHRSGKHTSTTDSDSGRLSTSNLPLVNPSTHREKSRGSEILEKKQQTPILNRSEIKYVSSSHPTTPSDDERPTHWIKNAIIPPIYCTDNETSTSREEVPQKVEQRLGHNQAPKKRTVADGQKRKEKDRPSHRSVSADSSTHIRLVDDKSLDSTSENNTHLSHRHRGNIKSNDKDVQTNTEQTNDSQQRQDSSSDEQKLTPAKPLKATKPMSDHLRSSHRRSPNRVHLSTTSDRTTPTVRCTVKQPTDSNPNKDPVNVNITVVVKKAADDETSQATSAEAFVEQKSPHYFQRVQQSPRKNKEKSTEHHDRHTQSDTEQVITEKQKKRRRPKRISRTCQTYECVFRRMERERIQELRATSDTEKNIQTRQSQLRPRKQSPKKTLSPYLSADSVRIEQILRKQYFQSRRNLSKSSSLARSVSPQGGKLLILRPTLPFHHTDAVDVQRVCLQYAIDLIPHSRTSTHRNKPIGVKQTNNLPMINGSAPSNKTEEHKHQRKNNSTV